MLKLKQMMSRCGERVEYYQAIHFQMAKREDGSEWEQVTDVAEGKDLEKLKRYVRKAWDCSTRGVPLTIVD